jgi:hypothetical protein
MVGPLGRPTWRCGGDSRPNGRISTLTQPDGLGWGTARPVGPINRCRGALHRPLLRSGPAYRSVPRCVADRSTSRWAARSAGCVGNSCLPGPNGPRPAQRASHSPSQGRRPWRWGDPTPFRQAQRADRSTMRVVGIVGPLGRKRFGGWGVTQPDGLGWGNDRPVGPINRCREALHRPLLRSGPHPVGPHRPVFVRCAIA